MSVAMMRDLQRQFEPERDLLHHRPLGPHRDAEVELSPCRPSSRRTGSTQRLVEAEPLALQLDRLLRDAAAVAAQLDLDDVAGNDAQHEEHEHRHAEQRRDHQQDAVDGVAEHVCMPACGPSRRRSGERASGQRLLRSARRRRARRRGCGSATSSSPSPSCGSARCGATTAAAADRPARTARFSNARIIALRFSTSRSRMWSS